MTNATSTSPTNNRDRNSIDNLLRRELKVGDPSDPQQIAAALADRYQNNTRAQSILGEAKGLPFLNTIALRPTQVAEPTATNNDLMQAKNDVEQDLQMLIADNLTKDIRPELEGWQTVLDSAIREGTNAARFGLDPLKRDTAFGVRRQLGDYARLSRLIGALTPSLNRSFRSLATSLDEVSAVILVLMGESMANLGFAGGRFLLQVPYTELQARRDAVLGALRQVDGVAAMAGNSTGTWPRGLRAYRQLSTMLEARGFGDLRSLMSETELSRTMDELIQLASGGSPSGMRAVGATAWAPLNRLQRFVNTTLRQVAPASPELATLHEALQLFIDGFITAGGFRLLRIARPTVLNYGLYGAAKSSRAENRLVQLVNHRGSLVRQLDCLTECACDHDQVLSQIVLDEVLFCVDRAIDLYAVGDTDFGLPEVRAASYSHLIDAMLPAPLMAPPLFPAGPLHQMWPWNIAVPNINPAYLAPVNISPAIQTELESIRQLLRPSGAAAIYPEATWWSTTQVTYTGHLNSNFAWLGGNGAPRFAQTLHDELCQRRQEIVEWRPVVEQMTSGCVPIAHVFADADPQNNPGCLPQVIDRALFYIEDATANALPVPVNHGCGVLQTIIPQHMEQTLEDISNKI